MNRIITAKSKFVLVGFVMSAVMLITSTALSKGYLLETRSSNIPLHEIPFEYDVDKIIVPVSVNGTKAVRCILDTGMPEGIFLMNPASAKGMKLEYVSTQVRLGGAGGGTESASLAMGASLMMAGVAFEDQRVIVKNEVDHFSRTDWIGVIGASVFNKYVVEIDVETQVIKLYAPDKFDPKIAGAALDLTLTRTKPHIVIPISIDGKKAVPVKVVVDTGASSGLMLPAKSDKGFQIPKKFIEGIFGAGIGGDISGKMARVKTLSLGEHSLSDVITLFKDGEIPANGEGLIGMRIMERFLVTFDYTNNKMYVRPNLGFDAPFEFDMIGMALRAAEGGGMDVVDVFKGSPAFEAGIRKGDKVTSFDGNEATFDLWSDIEDSMRTPGKKIKIGWMREGKKFEKEVVSRRLI